MNIKHLSLAFVPAVLLTLTGCDELIGYDKTPEPGNAEVNEVTVEKVADRVPRGISVLTIPKEKIAGREKDLTCLSGRETAFLGSGASGVAIDCDW